MSHLSLFLCCRSVFGGLLTLALLTAGRLAAAQSPTARLTLSGTVKDARSGEDLSGATVRVRELAGVGTAANAYGFYTLTVPPGSYTLEVSLLGYTSLTQAVALAESRKLDFRLRGAEQQLQEAVVTAKAADATISRSQMGVETLDLRQVSKVPVLFGERDIIKTLTLLPGVKSGGEGNGGLYVRGGAADQNLMLLDEAPVYNASHLLGFFSTFNSDALRDVTIYKGNMPAQYGGRLSSVLDVKMKDGNAQRVRVSGGLGLIASRLAVEGPLGRRRSAVTDAPPTPDSLGRATSAPDTAAEAPGSFIITGRRTYADVFLKLAPDSAGLGDTKLFFYDLNLKANYRLSARNRVFLSGYFGRDVLGLSKSFDNRYGNQTATLRWNHLFTDRLFSNTTFIYSRYGYDVRLESGKDQTLNVNSRIRDFNLKQDFEYYPAASHVVRFGVQGTHHTITPGQAEVSDPSGTTAKPELTKYTLESAAYISHEWQAAPRLHLTYGMRFSGLSVMAPGDFSTYDAAGQLLNTTHYSSGRILKTYWNPEPRAAASWQLTDDANLKASYTRNVQNIHVLSNASASSPVDTYLATTLNVKPETADQVALGYYRKLGPLALTVETYYKWLGHQIDYRDGTELRGNQNVEGTLLTGRGRAYGVELLLKKDVGRLTGWVGYTYARTERHFDQINAGDWYPARQDKPHDVSIVGIYQLTPKWSISATWLASTGSAVTYPVGKYNVAGQVVSYYGARNADRLPGYRRLDLGATYERPARGRFRSSWNFSLYNALGRQNPYSIAFETDPDDATRTRAVQTALFRWVPSATYNFSF